MSKKEFISNIFSFFYNIFSKHKVISRDSFLKKISTIDKVLEIGPFTNPCLRGKNVYYFDVLNKENLILRAKENNYPVTEIPEIHFVSADGNLEVVNETFDNVLSSHCVEHQPDLIKHLKDVSDILKPGGTYYLIIPDKRYCFDALLPESNIAAVIEAFKERKTKHSLKSVIEHRALTTHNNARRHWAGIHGTLENVSNRISGAMKEFEDANGRYIDVHAWQFTPGSFSNIINMLNELNYIDFKVTEIYHTALFSLEFYVVLKKHVQEIKRA